MNEGDGEKWKMKAIFALLKTGDWRQSLSLLYPPSSIPFVYLSSHSQFYQLSPPINKLSINQSIVAVPLRFCQFRYQFEIRDSIRFEWQSNHRRRDNNSASSTFVLWMEMDSLGEGGTNEPNEFYLMRPVPRSLQEDDDLLQHKLRSSGMSATYRRLRRSWKKIWADLSDRRRKTLYNEFEI